MPNEFEKEPSPVAPGTSGEVRRGIEDRAGDRVAQAGDVLAMIENEPRAVESLVDDANKGYEAGRVGLEDTAAADLVGGLFVADPRAVDIDDVARELHRAATEPLGEALKDLAAVDAVAAKAVMAAIDAVGHDGSGVEYGEKQPQLPAAITPDMALLRLTHERPGVGISLKKLEYRMPDASAMLQSLEGMPNPSEAEKRRVSGETIAYLRSRDMRLAAPVPSGSKGAETFDKTQRDRAMFKPGKTGGASSHESYCPQLFAGVSNPEVQHYVAARLEGKTVLNFGGGNAALRKELQNEHGVENVKMINVEPYPSDHYSSDPDRDTYTSANPAEPDFSEKTGMQPNSADEIWAVFSVPAYLETAEETCQLFDTVTTMLKPGGRARIGHLGFVGATENDPRKDALLDSLTRMADRGYLIEVASLPAGSDTLIITAPEGQSTESPLLAIQEYGGSRQSPRERAELLAEKMGGDVSPDVLHQIEERIKRASGEAPLLGRNYTQNILNATGDDYELKLRQIIEFARRDMSGQEVLSFDAVEVLLGNVTKATLNKKKQESGVGDELCYLAGIQAESEVNFGNQSNVRAHCKALRVLEAATDTLPIAWLKMLRKGTGGDIPEEVKRYVAKPEFIHLALEDVKHRFDSEESFRACFSEKGGTVAERKKKQREVMETINGALEALMEDSDESRRLLQIFKYGDIKTYGFDSAIDESTGEKTSALNERGWHTVTEYIDNAAVLGSDRLVALNKELGVVNFGSYSLATLETQEDILHNPQNHKNISLFVRGVDGDYNSAGSALSRQMEFKDTLIYEIRDEKDLESLDRKVASLRVSVTKLSLFGHGDEKGIALSNTCLMKRDTQALAKMTGLHRLINRIRPDPFGNKNVLLLSCSQGVKYDQHGSMAEILSRVADSDITVEAAPGVMYAYRGKDSGEVKVVVHPYYEVVQLLKKYDRYPGVKRLIKRLDDIDRRRAGSLRVSKNATQKNMSGNVRIGA